MFPAAAGYIILTRASLYRERALSLSNSRLFIESVLVGLFLLYISYSFLSISKCIFWHPIFKISFHENLMGAWNVFTWPLRNEIDAKGKPTNEAVFSILIAIFYVIFDDYLYTKADGQLSIRLRRKVDKVWNSGPIASMCILSMHSQVPVQITLKNRKVYIGLVLDLPNSNPSNKMQKFINILPLQSYTRNSEDLSVPKKVTDYSVLWELMVLAKSQPGDRFRNGISKKAQDLMHMVDPIVLENIDTGIVIDMDEIISISLWDSAIAKAFKK